MPVSFELLRSVCKNSPCSSQGHFPTNMHCRNICCLYGSAPSATFGLFRGEFPQVCRHRQGTLSPMCHRVKHHAFHFTFDAIRRCAHMLEALCCRLHRLLVVFMQEVFALLALPHALKIASQLTARHNHICQLVPHQVVHNGFLLCHVVQLLQGKTKLQ